MKLAIINNGCVKEDAMEYNFLNKMKENNIERANSLEESDYVLYITCGGVGEVVRKCVKDIYALEYYAREHNTKVIAVGCLINNHINLFDEIIDSPNVLFLQGKEWIIPVINYIKDMNKRNTYKEKLLNRTLCFDKYGTTVQFMLQEGCSNKCTFCKVHYMNHKLCSFPFELALEHLTKLIHKGTKKIALSGDNITLYGLDLYGKKRLHEFIHRLSKVDGLEWLNVNELVPGDMYKELIDEIISNPKVICTSLQLETASDRLLKLMNRNYNLEKYDYYAKKIIDNGKYIDTILMSGFPTETTEDMDITLKYLKDRNIVTQGICEYSDFKHIPSSKFEQYTKSEKRIHTRYLVNGKRIINYNIFKNNRINQTKLIYKDTYDGVHYFYGTIPDIITVSYSNRFNNITPGTIINEVPQTLVKRNKHTKTVTYKLK